MEGRGHHFTNHWRETCQVRRDLIPCQRNDDGSRNSPGTVLTWHTSTMAIYGSSSSVGCVTVCRHGDRHFRAIARKDLLILGRGVRAGFVARDGAHVQAFVVKFRFPDRESLPSKAGASDSHPMSCLAVPGLTG